MVPTLQRQARRAFIVALLTAVAGVARIVATVGGGPGWGMIGNDATKRAEHDGRNLSRECNESEHQ